MNQPLTYEEFLIRSEAETERTHYVVYDGRMKGVYADESEAQRAASYSSRTYEAAHTLSWASVLLDNYKPVKKPRPKKPRPHCVFTAGYIRKDNQ